MKLFEETLKKHQVRLERFDGKKFTALVDGKNFDISNLSESGMMIKDYHGQKNFNLKVMYHETVVYEGNGRVARKIDNDSGIILDPFLKTDMLQAINRCESLYNQFTKSSKIHRDINTNYIHLVAEMRMFFDNAKHYLDELEEEIHTSSLDVKKSYWSIAENLIFPKMVNELKKYSAKIHKFTEGLSEDSYQIYKNYFQTCLLDYYKYSSFVSRSLDRPLGYAGDYVMMMQVYREDFDGITLFGKMINQWAINESSSESVRLRKTYLRERISKYIRSNDRELSIVSMACGPAMEVADLIDDLSHDELKRVSFILLDQDQEALTQVKRNINRSLIKNQKTANVYIVPMSVKRIFQDDPIFKEIANHGVDFLYTAGLYDYLTQPLAIEFTRRLFNSLNPNGQIIVGNFHPSNPSQTIGDFCGNWRLLHRDEKDMNELVEGLEVSESWLHFDELGIDVFLNAIKQG